MKAKILLRIAALLILVHLLGHSIGHSTWDTPEDQKMDEVVAAMKGYKADFMGATKSMADAITHSYRIDLVPLIIMDTA